jgi:hypothetical protein
MTVAERKIIELLEKIAAELAEIRLLLEKKPPTSGGAKK